MNLNQRSGSALRRLVFVVAILGAVQACISPVTPDQTHDDAGSSGDGGVSSDAGSCLAETDAQLCTRESKTCGEAGIVDRCGALHHVDCGSCPNGMTCGAKTPNVCDVGTCTPESDQQFCARLGLNCGATTNFDNCGNVRDVSFCGTCTSPQTCAGGGTANVCGCSETEAALCERYGANCGSMTVMDLCGVQRTVSCGTCGSLAQCGTSTPNVCGCKAGYAGNGVVCDDIDECQTGNGGCSPDAFCTNTAGSRTCMCHGGFTGDGVICEDDNECLVNNGGCAPNATCTNIPGSRTCTCPPGYQGGETLCVPVNPCAEQAGLCNPTTSTCRNDAPGSYVCDCRPGFSQTGPNTCSDIDECINFPNNCSGSATCNNSPGSYTCTCNAGYTGNGVTCSAINRCANGTHTCDLTTSFCTFTGPDTFDCTCKTGYKLAVGQTCVAVDACLSGANNCDAATTTCRSTGPGTFTCDCNANYETPTGTSCSPIDLCSAGHTNSCNASTSTCQTTGPSTYDCTCKSGYQHPTSGGVPDPYVCENINECATYGNSSANTCSDNAKCTDRSPTSGDPSKFICTCNDGFFGTGYYSASGPTCLPRYTQVAVGNQHICAIRADTAGTLVCWGWNTLCQLGNGQQQTCSGGTCSPILTPVAVRMDQISQWEATHGGASSWFKIAAGADTSCGIRANGDLWCWGWNVFGQVGNNTSVTQSVPVLVASGMKWSDVSTDVDHTFGVSTISGGNGQAFSWGLNVDFQLGTGNTAQYLSPMPVNLAAPPVGPNFLSVGAGYIHGCGLGATGKIYCWGQNNYGQLGQITDSSQAGYTPQTWTPLEIQAANSSGSSLTSTGFWDRLYAGYNSNCALQADSTTTGSLWCWGANVSGQLGDKTQVNRPAPVPVRNSTNGVDSWWLGVANGNTSVPSVVLGESHTCGIKSDQTIACWGNNTSNQLGKGSAVPATQLYPVPIAQPAGISMSNPLHFNRISARKTITCAITEDQPGQIPQSDLDQRLVCWGGTAASNAFGYGATPVFINK